MDELKIEKAKILEETMECER